MARRRTRKRTTRRRTRRRRRRNPAISWMDLLMAGLGGLAVGAGAYALDGTELTKAQVGGIEAAGGLALGAAVSMASKPIGLGIAGGGVATGAYHLTGELMAASAANGAENNGNNTSAIRANLGAVRGRMTGAPIDVSAANQVMSAIRANIT